AALRAASPRARPASPPRPCPPTRARRDLHPVPTRRSSDLELGRYGFTGRTAHMYRRNDPTTFRAEGPLQGVDVQTTGLRPTDQDDPAGEPLLLFSNDDCRISLSRRAETAPFHTRNVDGDELHFVHEGHGEFETEFGRLPY